ncbi:MAG: hypothetical protein LBF41_09110, partial [Deltaproteobacteria bacterium]|nr:hypothetical protein [Deltaproteobacteria bacterium]
GTKPKKPLRDDWAQPGNGRGFSEDSILLAGFLPKRSGGIAADLGAGSGVVGLEALVSGRLKGLGTLVLVEILAAFEPFLAANVARAESLLGDRDRPAIRTLIGDHRELAPEDLGGPADLLVSNPPYFPTKSHRVGKGPFGSTRHETDGTLADLIGTAERLLKPGGTFSLCLPRERTGELLEALRETTLEPSLFVFPPRKGARLLLTRLRKRGDPKPDPASP